MAFALNLLGNCSHLIQIRSHLPKIRSYLLGIYRYVIRPKMPKTWCGRHLPNLLTFARICTKFAGNLIKIRWHLPKLSSHLLNIRSNFLGLMFLDFDLKRHLLVFNEHLTELVPAFDQVNTTRWLMNFRYFCWHLKHLFIHLYLVPVDIFVIKTCFDC